MLSLLLSLALTSRAQTVPLGPNPGAPAAPIGQGPQFQADVQAALDQYFPDLHEDVGPSIDSLKARLRSETNADRRASLLFVYNALREKPEGVSLTPATTRRLQEVAEHVQRKPELASKVSEPIEPTAAVEPVAPQASPSPTLEAARRPRPAEPPSGPIIFVPKHLDVVRWNGEEFPVLAYPTNGDDPLGFWLKAQRAAAGTRQANYNYDLVEMAQATVDAAKQGKPQVLVGDYSNWFPHKLSQTNHGGQHQDRTEAMNLILANLGPNLKLYIAKGLGTIGINHNKFTKWDAPAQPDLDQGGSANYTQSSFTPKTLTHWEEVYFYLDKARSALDGAYLDFLIRHAKPFSESLEPKDVEPHFDPSDPIPVDPSPSLAFGGKLFPLNSFSPNGGTEDWLVLAEQLSDAGFDILMFSPFPTDRMKQGILSALAAGLPVRMLADKGQGHNALPFLKPLVAAGMPLRLISGPGAVSNPHAPFDEHQKMHMKVMRFRRKDGQGLKKKGSLNISKNALAHNFENNPFSTDEAELAVFDQMFSMMWELGEAPTQQDFERAEAAHAANGGPSGPWTGEPPKLVK